MLFWLTLHALSWPSPARRLSELSGSGEAGSGSGNGALCSDTLGGRFYLMVDGSYVNTSTNDLKTDCSFLAANVSLCGDEDRVTMFRDGVLEILALDVCCVCGGGSPSALPPSPPHAPPSPPAVPPWPPPAAPPSPPLPVPPPVPPHQPPPTQAIPPVGPPWLQIDLPGGSTARASGRITLRAVVLIGTSGPAEGVTHYQFNWTVVRANASAGEDPLLTAIDADRTLLLPRNTLPAGTACAVILRAAAYSSAATILAEVHTPLELLVELPVARVAGGDERVLAALEPLALDGTSSYDPLGRPLRYLWSCVEVSTPGGCAAFSTAASLAPAATAATAATLTVPAAALAPSSLFVIALAVSTEDGRAAAAPATVSITTLMGPAPLVTVEPVLPSGASRFSTTDTLRVRGAAAYQDAAVVAWRYRWQLANAADGSQVTLPSAAASAKDLLMPLGAAGGTQLAAGAYIASLAAAPETAFVTDADEAAVWAGEAGVASVTVHVNAPPAMGALAVVPPSGEAGATSFVLQAQGFSDPDGPLRVSYWCEHGAGGGRVPLSDSLLMGAALSTVLPSPGEAVTVGCSVSDAYGAMSEATATVAVAASGLSFEAVLADAAAATGAQQDAALGLQLAHTAVQILQSGGAIDPVQAEEALVAVGTAYNALVLSPAATTHVALLVRGATTSLSGSAPGCVEALERGLALNARLLSSIGGGSGSDGVLRGSSARDKGEALRAVSGTYGNVALAASAVQLWPDRGSVEGSGGSGEVQSLASTTEQVTALAPNS